MNGSADVSAIDHIRQRLEAAENAGDAEAMGALLTDDAVLMVPDYPVQEGKAACVGFTRGLLDWLFARFHRRIAYLSSEVAVMGDVAFDRGTFSFVVSPKANGASEQVTGKYFWLLRREPDRRWKVARVIVTRDDASEPSST